MSKHYYFNLNFLNFYLFSYLFIYFLLEVVRSRSSTPVNMPLVTIKVAASGSWRNINQDRLFDPYGLFTNSCSVSSS